MQTFSPMTVTTSVVTPASLLKKCCLSRLLFAVALVGVTSSEVSAQDAASRPDGVEGVSPKLVWSNWMGPNHDGISTETGWSTEWPTDGLPVRWKKEIGIGFSSFSVVDGLAYSMGHRDGKETVWCLDAETGDEVWTHSYPAELNPNLYDGGPGSTPTVHADMVFTLSVDGRLIGFRRKTGDIVWEVNLQQDLQVGMHEWGFNASPYILGNQLLLECGRVVSYDWKTGEKLWQSAKHRAGYGSVRAFTYEGQTLLASLDCDGLRISRSNDGSEVALSEWPSPFGTNSTTPIIFKDRIFISTGYNVGSVLFRLTADGLQQKYAHRQMRNHFNNCILFEGHLYGFDGNSNLGRVVRLTCMDFETGEVKWMHAGPGCGSLIVANGHLLILSDQGDLILAKASPEEFVEVSRSRFLAGRCWTAPVLINGHVYGRNSDGKAVCSELPKQLR
ncbi:MAG: PQQ-binding-like beta-propeller repeat protein [Planctomycetota bacterium]|nr:PQQ-binding-like beta-propeller repeat protein [Planctomycetota bacterium]MDA1165761.1 PQQ-binding-like beta-propeller repeat protein [Planctomycetota bacterium]